MFTRCSFGMMTNATIQKIIKFITFSTNVKLHWNLEIKTARNSNEQWRTVTNTSRKNWKSCEHSIIHYMAALRCSSWVKSPLLLNKWKKCHVLRIFLLVGLHLDLLTLWTVQRHAQKAEVGSTVLFQTTNANTLCVIFDIVLTLLFETFMLFQLCHCCGPMWRQSWH